MKKTFPRTAPLLVGASLVTLATNLVGAPILHEYFDPDVAGLGMPSGAPQGFPETLETQAGSVDAPRLDQPNRSGSYAQTASRDEAYGLDSDTSRPDLVGYSDPFTPSIPPFKRSFAYDSVSSDFQLVVADSKPQRLPLGGRPQSTDDQFFADMNVTLTPGDPVRIPSVGPHARVIAARLSPDVAFELSQDSAENWFISSANGGEYRLIMHLAIDRKVFGSEFSDATWPELQRSLPPLPVALAEQTRPVLEALGLSRRIKPRQALRLLVQHFRSFASSDERLGSRGVALYHEIALSRKGVCRHRSFAFVITALGLGIPARFVRNEAHAWVEVFDGQLWHRIDLGGAAGRMEISESGVMPHTPPADPFEWPSGSESGTEMAQQALTSGGQPGAGSSTASGAAAAGEPEADATSNRTPTPTLPRSDPPPAEEPDAADEQTLFEMLATPQISIHSPQQRATRGQRLEVRGQVVSGGQACQLARVDIKLQSEAGQWHLLGTLVTDDAGGFSGAVTLPSSVPVGDYELLAVTPGSQTCGPGNSLDGAP